jgi:hypothetical protein
LRVFGVVHSAACSATSSEALDLDGI